MTTSRVERLELRFKPKPWAFAEQRRAEIDTHFAAAQRVKPKLWNGRVLVMHECKIDDGVLRGAFLETDYASFHAWIAWGRPPADAWDCFGSAAVLGSDGAFLLAQMAAHTANAGRIYFPCGTPDPLDVRNGAVDFDESIRRELLEETGLAASGFTTDAGWIVVQEPARAVAYKILRAGEAAAALRARVERHMTKETVGELAAIHLVRGPADIVPEMPCYVTAFLRYFWRLAA